MRTPCGTSEFGIRLETRTIGNNCRIGANAVVYMDMPDNSVAVASPTRLIQKENLDNRFVVANKDGSLRYYEDGKFHQLNKKEECIK